MEIPGYTLKHRIGQGRFSSVYLANDDSGAIHAVKIIIPRLSRQKLFRQEFKRHISLLTNVNHPNCTRVYDAGIVDECCYMVMDYFPDGSIAPRLIFGFPVKQIIKILLELIDAVEYLSQNNISHRNIQPRNIFIDKNNQTILSEYEVVKQILHDRPEIQFQEENELLKQLVDCQTDVNCLGLVFFKLLNRDTTSYLEVPTQSLSGRRAVCWQPTINKLFSKEHDESISNVNQLRNEIQLVQEKFKKRINQAKSHPVVKTQASSEITHNNNSNVSDLVAYVLEPKKLNFSEVLKTFIKKEYDLETFLLEKKMPIMTGLAASTCLVIALSLMTYFEKKYDSSDPLAKTNSQNRPDILFPQHDVPKTDSLNAVTSTVNDKTQLTEADIRQRERLDTFKREQKAEKQRIAILEQQQEEKRLIALKLVQEEKRLAELEIQQEKDRLAALQKQQEAERLAELQKQKEAERLAVLRQKKEELEIALKQKKEEDHLIDLRQSQKQKQEELALLGKKKELKRIKREKERQRFAAINQNKEKERIATLKKKIELQRSADIKKEKMLRQQRLKEARLLAEEQEVALQEKKRQEKINKLENEKKKSKFESFATF